MAITGNTKSETWEYFSRYDKAVGDDAKTKWILGALDVNIRTYLGDMSFIQVTMPDGKPAMRDLSATRNLEAVRFGLRGVENYKDPDGNAIPIKFVTRIHGAEEYQVVSDETLSTIPPIVLGELGVEIISKNTLTEEMRKKLVTA